MRMGCLINGPPASCQGYSTERQIRRGREPRGLGLWVTRNPISKGASMEAIVANLLNRFEKGALSRRELVQGLTLLAAGGAAANAQAPGLKATKIDHVSIQVTDLPRAVAFYQKTF